MSGVQDKGRKVINPELQKEIEINVGTSYRIG